MFPEVRRTNTITIIRIITFLIYLNCHALEGLQTPISNVSCNSSVVITLLPLCF